MTPPKNIRIAALGAAAVALAAGGAAVAASKLHGASGAPQVAAGSFVSSSSGTSPAPRFGGRDDGPGFGHGHGGGDLAAAATYLGITQDALMTQLQSGKTLGQIADATSGKSKAGLIAALVAAEKTEIAADVTAGRLTQAQADTIIAGLNARVTAQVDSTAPGPGGPHGGPGGGDDLQAAAGYLGVSLGALQTQLQSGKTLGQIADATSGKSKAGLVAALVAAEKTELAAKVKSGELTQAQADQIGSSLEQRFTDMANGTFRDHDGHDGPPPAGTPAPSGSSSSNGTHI